MITTYGVGSVVAIGDQSFIVSGLDTWAVDPDASIYEPRLQAWLGVSRFQLPPADEPASGDGVRVRQFPEIYSCAGCHELKKFREFGSPRGKSICTVCEKALTPSRFVLACEDGHLDDFPYFEWVHNKTSPTDGSFQGGHELSLHSSGRTASLRSVIIRCSCGKEASLEGAFGRRAMDALGISCKGRRPWLGRGFDQAGCTAIPRTLQRGSSAAWFPINRSALSIPPWSQTLQKRINPQYAILSQLLTDRVDDEIVLRAIEAMGILQGTEFPPEEVLLAVRRRQEMAAAARSGSTEIVAFESGDELRRQEYEQLLHGTATVDRGHDFECARPAQDSEAPLPYGVARSMLVKRLREVRVLQSFTRVEMPDPINAEDRTAALATGDIDWLPAIEVSGEGVFLTLDEVRLREWEERTGPVSRARHIRENHTAQMRRRAVATGRGGSVNEIHSPVRARYVLLHTLAHILINEWSLDAGYPAAALRERLYVADDMAGVLIYTATSDSAGSLGGVVAQGEYRRLRKSLESALSRATWCSQDPPCMESEASGADSLNLAACYACVLLPETSCETNNVFLDRALLVGTNPDDQMTGYFSRGD